MSKGKTAPQGFFDKHTHYGFMEKFKRLTREDQAKVEAFMDSLDDDPPELLRPNGSSGARK